MSRLNSNKWFLRERIHGRVKYIIAGVRTRIRRYATRHLRVMPRDNLQDACVALPSVTRMQKEFISELDDIGNAGIEVFRRVWNPETNDFWLRDQTTGILLDPFQADYWLNTADIKQVWKLSCCNHFMRSTLRRIMGVNGPDSGSAAEDIVKWSAANESKSGVNWVCPMVGALRLASWCWALRAEYEAGLPAEEADEKVALNAIADHINHIVEHFECDGLRTNHFVSNLSGVHLALQLFPGLHGAEAVEKHVRQRLEDEIVGQVDEEGVDYEFSLHYHRLVTELFAFPLFLNCALGRDDFSPSYQSRVRKMVAVLEVAVNRAGYLPQIGDNDSEVLWCHALDGDAPRNISRFLRVCRHFLDCAERVPLLEAMIYMTGFPFKSRPPSTVIKREDGETYYSKPGWRFVRHGSMDIAFVCGPLGAGGCGVHDHAHQNQMLLSVTGLEFLVDPGTGVYTRDEAFRNRLRSTASHNTVDLLDQECLWPVGLAGLWQMRRGWTPRSEMIRERCWDLECRYINQTMHRRKVSITKSILVEDEVTGRDTASLRWIMHPDVAVSLEGDGIWLLRREKVTVRLLLEGGEGILETVPYSDFFSDCQVTNCIHVTVCHQLKTRMELVV